jgi:hypothetical protein
VHAWDALEPPDPRRVDVRRYVTLLIRAAASVMQPLGADEAALRDRLISRVIARPALIPQQPGWLAPAPKTPIPSRTA